MTVRLIAFPSVLMFLPAETIAIRVYGVVFCLVIVAAELGITQAIREMVMVRNWMSRGAFYVFVGLLTVEQSEEDYVSAVGWVNLYVLNVGFIMIALGVLYTLMVRAHPIHDIHMYEYKVALPDDVNLYIM